nr:MAG TPA: hypothetical protein [Caudoviricetes sp.]
MVFSSTNFKRRIYTPNSSKGIISGKYTYDRARVYDRANFNDVFVFFIGEFPYNWHFTIQLRERRKINS